MPLLEPATTDIIMEDNFERNDNGDKNVEDIGIEDVEARDEENK